MLWITPRTLTYILGGSVCGVKNYCEAIYEKRWMLVISVNAFSDVIVCVILGRGRFAYRGRGGRGGPIMYVLIVSSVFMTRACASCASISVTWRMRKSTSSNGIILFSLFAPRDTGGEVFRSLF